MHRRRSTVRRSRKGIENMEQINESLAKRSYENYSFSNYKPGTATAEYNAAIANAAALIERAKAKVSDEGKARLDSLLERYSAQLAAWTNRHNANGSTHVSQMIAGPANYNMRAHEKFISREDKIWEEYNEIQDIERKIHAIVNGDKIIKSTDANAIEKLQEKLRGLEESQEMMKVANKIIRNKKLTTEEKIIELVNMGVKETTAQKLLMPDCFGGYGFASYSLTNNNATIRATKDRIEHLEKLAKIAAETPQVEIEAGDETGVKIVDNNELQRVQIFFPDKPSAECRNELKSGGFRWAPSNGSWQAFQGYRTIDKAQAIVNKYYKAA